jgi:hypothetical protein
MAAAKGARYGIRECGHVPILNTLMYNQALGLVGGKCPYHHCSPKR